MKRYRVWHRICESGGIEGWDAEIVSATDKEAAFRKVHRWTEPYNSNWVELADREIVLAG